MFSTEGGDEGEKEDQRQQRKGEREADLIGQVEFPENPIGQAEATTGLIDCQVVRVTPSEEVVTHHFDELWHLGHLSHRVRPIAHGGSSSVMSSGQ